MIKVFLNRGEELDVLRGTPHIYDNEISHIKYANGAKAQSLSLDDFKTQVSKNKISPFTDNNNQLGTQSEAKDATNKKSVADFLCEVYSKSGLILGSGVINTNSKIVVRLLTRKSLRDMGDPNEFIKNNLKRAITLRKTLYKNESFRVCFAESDGVPGFICDNYIDEKGCSNLVCMFSALACEIFRDTIIKTLINELQPRVIYERCDEHIRGLEGLNSHEGFIFDQNNQGHNTSFAGGEIIIKENGVKFTLDIAAGQKTGHFLDQRDNRLAVRKFCNGKTVLDCFCHTGGFALNAFFGGAKSVIASDISCDALDITKRNIELNGASRVIDVKNFDAFELLHEYEAQKSTFDVIILDPPAFTKSAANITKAYGGYKEINLRALKLLVPCGVLITCSCSHFFDEVTFIDMLTSAAKDCHRTVQILSITGAASDHPILLGYDKSRYLKCVTAIVL